MYFPVHFIWTVLEVQKELEALLEICFSYECLFLVLSFFWSQAATNIPKRYTSDHRKSQNLKTSSDFTGCEQNALKKSLEVFFRRDCFLNRKYSSKNVDCAYFLMISGYLRHPYPYRFEAQRPYAQL